MYNFDGLPYILKAIPDYEDCQGMIRAKQAEWLGLYMANSTFYQHKENTQVADGEDGTVVESWARQSLHPFKMVCTELANGIFNEGTEYKTANEAANEYLQGWVTSKDYQTICNKSCEWSMALGTSAQVLSFSKVSPDGVPAPDTDIDIIRYDAQEIYPITYQDDDISECGFALLTTYAGDWVVQVSIIRKDDDSWTIENHWYNYGGANLSKDKWSEIKEIESDDLASFVRVEKCPFAILKPAIANIYAANSPLGVSAFDDAIPAGQLVDLAFCNFMNDIELGQKMVFLDESMLQGKRGSLTVPFDVKKRLFVNIDRGIGDSSKQIDEYNPSLRANENLTALSTALSALGLRAGFGADHWKIDKQTGAIRQTATAVMMDSQAMVLTFKRHENSFRRPLQDLLSCLLSVKGFDEQVTIDYDDSILQDTDRSREIDRQEVAAGLMPKWVYIQKWNALSEEEAKAWVNETDLAAF